MAINFPTGQTLNQIYTYGGYSWQWNGNYWQVYPQGLEDDTFVTGFTLSNNLVNLTQNRTDNYSSFTISLSAYTGSTGVSGNYLPLSGGTLTGGVIFQNGLTANTISATTYFNLPVSGLTSGTGIQVSGSNGNYTISFTGSTGTSGDYLPLSGGTVTGGTQFTGGLTANTISATTYQNLPVSGLTGGNNISVTGSNGNFTISFTGTTGSSFTGGTVSGATIFTNGLTANTISATTYQNLPVSGLTGGDNISVTGSNGNFTISFTGTTGTSGEYLPLSGGTVTGTTQFTAGLTANTISATTYYNVSSNFKYEIHVSQIDGNDTTGNGTLLNPVATITKALTLITGNRKTIIIHPGTYTESPSITTQYTTLTGPGLIGGNIVIAGSVSTSVGCTISGLKMTNLTVTAPTGTGNVNILNCEVSGTLTKSSNADYTVLRLCDFNAASITGAGLVAIFGGNPNFITVNNASANVIVKSAVTVAPVLTAGTLSLVDSVVGAAVTNAVTSAASSIITLANCQFLTSALTGVAPVVLNGFYSILNCVYDKPNSTLVASSGTGGSYNSVDYFQFINADKFITQGGTSLQYVMGDGSLSNGFTGGTVSGATNFTNGLTANTISATTYFNLPVSGLTEGNNISITGVNGNFTISFTGTTGGGGGGGQTFYLNLSQSQGGNRLLSTTGSTASEQTSGVTISNGVTSTIASFQSQPLNITLLPGGIWSFYLHSYKENNNATFNIFVELYKRTSGGTQTLLFTTDPAPVTTNSPNPSMQLTDGYFSGTPLSVSDSIVAVVRATNTGNQSHIITLVTEGSQHYSYAVSTIPTQQGLTCDTLSGCSIIQTIQTDVSNKLDKSGGTISGDLIINSGLTANTISATTYQNLPVSAVTNGDGISASTSGGVVTITNTRPQGITGVTGTDGLSSNTTNFITTIINIDKGSSQNIFKNIQIGGITQFSANSNNSDLNFSGIGITITSAATNTLVFTNSITQGITGITSGDGITATTSDNNVTITNLGVTGITAGYGISASTSTGNVVIIQKFDYGKAYTTGNNLNFI